MPDADRIFGSAAQIVRGMECFQGITLSPEREQRVKDIRALIDKEMHLTCMLLQSRVHPWHIYGNRLSPIMRAELGIRMLHISNSEANMRTLRQNLIESNCLQEYERLVKEEETDWSYLDEIF